MNALDFHQPPPRVRTLAEAQALIDQLRGLGRVVQGQQVRIEQLEEQLRLHSGDTSKPPSSDDAKARAERRKKPRSGRKRGTQPGHPDGAPRGQARVMVEAVDHTERYYPDGHCSCGGAIEPDRAADRAEPALRHQVFDQGRAGCPKCATPSPSISSTGGTVAGVASGMWPRCPTGFRAGRWARG